MDNRGANNTCSRLTCAHGRNTTVLLYSSEISLGPPKREIMTSEPQPRRSAGPCVIQKSDSRDSAGG